MSPKILHFEITLIYFLLLIPWPHTQIIKLLCSRDNSRLVRKIVRSKWTPILDKYQVKLPLECPLHPFRDLFAPRQDAKKRDRPTQWTCRKCGKSFYKEKFLDLHFDTRHHSILNRDEDAVCVADFCDIMRCEVFQSEESSLTTGDSHVVTDIEVWGDSFGQNSALAKANAAYLSLIPLRTSAIGASRAGKVQQHRQLCPEKLGQSKFKDTQKDTSNTESSAAESKSKTSNEPIKKRSGNVKTGYAAGSSSNVKSSTKTTQQNSNSKKRQATNESDELNNNGENEQYNEPSDNATTKSSNASNVNATQFGGNGNATHMQKVVRANCRAEELSKLKSKCEYLVRSCIAGLLLGMTDHSFKEMEEEMNKAVCWYLSCDRYWEDGPLEPRAFPWGLIVILVFVLSTGICFCYYIIWILFDSEETTINANYQQQQLQQQQHYMHPQQQQQLMYQQQQQQQYYYQQQHDLYPEQPRYDYRHSPRRYAERAQQQQHPHGTPNTNAAHHAAAQQQQQQQMQQSSTPQQNQAYTQDIFDRRDFTNRPSGSLPTTAVTSGGGVSGSSSSLAAAASAIHMDPNDPTTMIGDGARHYNPNQHLHQLESHHRQAGGSQTSLRASASAHEIIQSDAGHNEHYIYVTYPPDLKKRFFEKYE